MFTYFFNAYKHEIYNKRNKITWQDFKSLNFVQKIITGFSILVYLLFFFSLIVNNEKLFWSSLAIIILILISLNIFLKKYDLEKNRAKSEKYQINEIEEIKKILRRSEYSVFNSQRGLNFLIEECRLKKEKKSYIQDIFLFLFHFIEVAIIPIIIVVVSMLLQSMPVYEAISYSVGVATVGFITVFFLRLSFSSIEDIIKKDNIIAEQLYGSLKYIQLTLDMEKEEAIKLIV